MLVPPTWVDYNRGAWTNARLIRARVVQRFSRISFQMVAGTKVFDHLAARQRD